MPTITFGHLMAFAVRHAIRTGQGPLARAYEDLGWRNVSEIT